MVEEKREERFFFFFCLRVGANYSTVGTKRKQASKRKPPDKTRQDRDKSITTTKGNYKRSNYKDCMFLPGSSAPTNAETRRPTRDGAPAPKSDPQGPPSPTKSRKGPSGANPWPLPPEY